MSIRSRCNVRTTSRRNARRHPRRPYFEALESRVLMTAQPTGWTPLGVGLGGTCYYANTNPLDSNEMYLQTDMGEVWHTLDAGLHWTTLNEQTQLHSNANIDPVQFTSDVNIQYSISSGTTPYVTKDHGVTWTQLKDWSRIKAQDGGDASHLLVDPNNTNRLLLIEQKKVGSNYNWWIYQSNDGGNTLTPINTGGAGASDTSGTEIAVPWSAGAYWNGNNIYFATFQGLYKTTNGGTNWTFTSSSALSKPNNPNGFNVNAGQTSSKIVSFAATSYGAATRLWALTWNGDVTAPSSTGMGYSSYAGLYTSTDGGSTWTNVDGTTWGQSTVRPLTARWVQTANATSAADVDKVWVGGGDSPTSSAVVYSSTNAGGSWTRLLKTGADTTNFPGELPNENVYTRAWGVGGDYGWGYLSGTVTFNVNKSNPNVITFTGMGTLWGTWDGGANWYNLEGGGPNQLPNSAWNPKGQAITKGTMYNNSEANETSAWDVTFIDPNTIFISDTDVAGQFTRDGGAHWAYLQVPGMSNPNTFYDAEYVPSTDMLYAVTANKHDIFTLNYSDGSVEQFGSDYILQSADHGATWSVVHTFPVAAPAHNLVIDPNNPDVAYVALDNHNYGTGGIWKTTNLSAGAASTWTYLPNQPSRDIDNNGTQDFASMFPSQLTMLSDGTLIVVAGIRYTGTGYRSPNDLSYTSGVWVSTDGGNSWDDRSSPIGDDSDIYNGGQNMYYTQGNLLTTQAMSVCVDPNDPTQNTWYATTYYFGTQSYGTVYKSTDRGAHWSNWISKPQSGSTPYQFGQAENLWIQPGGTIMLASTKSGLWYTPDYTVANPQFYNVQTMPFNGSPSFRITSDPFNSDRIYLTTHGAGIWRADLSVITKPGTVQNVTARTMSNSEALIGWEIQGPPGTGYVIQKSTDGINWTTAGTSPSWTETSFLVTGLSANTQYSFRVLTANSAGNSDPSPVATARTDAAAGVTAVEEFTQGAGALNGTGSGTGWSGTWTGNSAADTIVAGTINAAAPPDSAGNYAQITSSGVDATRLLPANLGTPGSVVWVGFEVSTATGSNLLIGDSTNGIGIGTQTYSSYPSMIAIRGGVVTYKQSATSMTAGIHFFAARLEYRTDGTVYVQLYRDPTPGKIYPDNKIDFVSSWDGVFTAAQLPATLTTNKITLMKPASGTAKYDEVRIGGTYLDVAPKASTTAPSAPSGIAGTVVDQNRINLSWTNNASNQMGFTIERWNGTAWSTIERLYNTSASGTVINYAVTNLPAASTSQFRVSAFNSAGSSATNATGNLTTLVDPPARVSNLAVTVANGNFNVTWSDVANETGYVLQYADATSLRKPFNNGELNWVTVTPNLAANATSYTFTTLSTNRLYYFRIYGTNAGGKAFCSNTPSAVAFPAPSAVAARGVADTQAIVSWTDSVVGETGFNVQYSTNGTTWTTGPTVSAGSTQAVVNGLAANTIYYFRVQAFAPGSTGNWSGSVQARTFATLSGQIAYEGFNFVPGSGANWNGQPGGVGFTDNWVVNTPTSPNSVILPGSMTSSSSTNLATTGNSAQLYQSTSASRNLNYTLGQDGTSLWVAFEINQHITGGTGVLQSSLTLGNGDASNYLQLGSPWNTWYDGIAKIGGSTYYMQSGSNPASVADNTPAFLVYRLDFGSGTTGDSVRLWVNPTPGTTPSDASANSTWTLSASTHFNFTNNNIRINDASYYDQATWDELRFGTNYGAVAPIALPSAPTTLNATPGTGSVALTWADTSNNEAGFHLQRSTDQTNWTTINVAANATSYNDTVAAGTYYYRLSSYNATGDSMPTSTVSAVVGGVPAAPSSLAGTPGVGAVAFTWADNSGNETGFHLWRSTDNVNFTNVQTFGVNATSGSNTIAPGTYYYKLTAYNGSGDSAFSNTVTSTVLAAPSAPSGLSATTASSSQINLAWTDNASNESGFKIYRSTDGTNFSLYQTINTANTTSYNATGLSAGTQYWFRVTAFNSGGESANSNTANATTTAVTGLIASDAFNYTSGTGLSGKGAAGSGWAGAWTANANVTVAATSLTPPGSLQTSAGSITTGTGGGTSTRNLSSALNTSGTVWSSVLIKPDLITGPGPHYGRLIVGNTMVSYSQESDGTYHFEISANDGSWYGSHWNSGANPVAANGTTYFLVLEQVFNGGTDTVYAWLNPTPGSTAPTTASAFETKANINAGGTLTNIGLNSAYYSNTGFDELRVGNSYADVAPTSAAPPAAPSNLVANPGTSTIGLTWTDNSTGETGFHIYRSTDNATWGSAYATVGSNVTSYTDNAPTAGTGYYYKVNSYNGTGDSTTAAGMSYAIATVIAYDGFNYTPGTLANLNGGTGGVGFSGAWTAANTSVGFVNTGSLSYTSGSNALLTSGNSVTFWKESTDAIRPLNYTLGQDDTSLWVGFAMKQHASGGAGTMYGRIQLGSDASNNLALGSPWNAYYDGLAQVGGVTKYWNNTTAASPVDGQTDFLVYRIDFGHQAGNTSPDKVLMWVNPTPGTQPTDASATATWTLPTGTYFAFTDNNLRLKGSTYWNQVTLDEVRLGVSYVAVAPDPIVAALSHAPSKTAVPPTRTDPVVNRPAAVIPVTPEQAVAHFVTTVATLPALQGGDETNSVAVTVNHRIPAFTTLMTSDTPTRLVDLTPELATITATARRHIPGLDPEDQEDQEAQDNQEEGFWE